MWAERRAASPASGAPVPDEWLQRRSPEREREEGGPLPSATYGSSAISLARLIATAICR